MSWSLRLVLGSVLISGVLGGGVARGEEDDDVRARVAEALREGRRDVAYEALDSALRRASQSNQPARLARLQLFRAELDADRPNDKVVEWARSAMLKLGDVPEAVPAAVRYHVSGAQVALAQGKLGQAALHVQEGRAALAKRKEQLGAGAVKDLARDMARLGDAERGLVGRLRKAVEEGKGATGALDAGGAAALAAYSTGKPLVAEAAGPDPVAPKSRPSGMALLARLDKALSDAEERDIAAAEERGEGKAASAARSQHAETLARLGKRDEAITARRVAQAWHREKGKLEDVVAEGRWIAEQLERDKRAHLAARREVVDDVERAAATTGGPARAALRAKFRADYVAYVEAAAAVVPGITGTRSVPPAKPVKGDKESKPVDPAADALRAIELIGDRSGWEDVALVGDPERWRRAGAQGADLRRSLDEVARMHAGRTPQELLAVEDENAPAARQRQKAIDALMKGDVAPPAGPVDALDPAALSERIGGRALVAYGRLDEARLAVAVLPPASVKGGTVRMAILVLGEDQEAEAVGELRAALRPIGPDDDEAESATAYKAPAQRLHEALIAPITAAIGGADAIVVVPDGALGLVPFAVLEDKKGKRLGDTAAVSFVPSLRALLRPTKRVGSRRALVLGVGRYTEQGFPQLPNAEKEAKAIEATLSGSNRAAKALSPAITTEKFVTEPGEVDVLHVAARARLDGDSPALGYVTLATTRLFAFELPGAALRGNVVVLDGVGSAVQPPGPASRGLTGLVSGALQGPGQSVLTSQWSAEGPSSASLLQRFVELYTDGKPPALALALAQREMAAAKLEQPLLNMAGADPLADGKRFVHPRYWAPFVVWGEP